MVTSLENPGAAGEASGARQPAAAVEGLVFKWPSSGFRLEIGQLVILPGERVFLSGPSGGGKSTLLGLMAGVLAPLEGSVSIGGSALSSLSPSARDKLRGERVGIIFQQFNLVPYLTALDNAVLPLRLNPGRRARVSEGVTMAATNLLERLGLDEGVWRRPSTTLSVGQSQRVAAARALIGRPPLILADEPTSALDEDARVAFLRTLLFECSEAGSGLLFASHDRRLSAEFDREVRLVRKGSLTILEEASKPRAGEASHSDGEAPLSFETEAFS